MAWTLQPKNAASDTVQKSTVQNNYAVWSMEVPKGKRRLDCNMENVVGMFCCQASYRGVIRICATVNIRLQKNPF